MSPESRLTTFKFRF